MLEERRETGAHLHRTAVDKNEGRADRGSFGAG